MNLALIGRLLAGFTLFFSCAMTIPLGLALAEETRLPTVRGFATAMGLGLFVALVLWIGGRGASRDFFRKEGLVVVGFAWLIAGALGAIPFEWSGAIPRGADAFFEAVSGLTTTGATVLGSGGNEAIEALPPSLLLWRSMLQWMGGLGVILVFIVLLPAVGVAGSKLLSSEQIGVATEGLQPRVQAQARALFRFYLVVTAAAVGCYWLAGMNAFDAACHAMTTMATGGFSTKNLSIGQYQSLPIELVAIVFMFVAGCNFVLLVQIALGRGREQASALQSVEFRVYLLVTVLIIVAMTVALRFWGGTMLDPALDRVRDYSDVGTCLREAAFQTVSILTSTGYQVADFQNWPVFALALMLFCMLVGGCTGSTAGGIKILRLLACTKLMGHAVRTFIRPKVVVTVKVGKEAVSDAVLSTILAIVLLWFVTVAVGTLVLLADPRLDFLSALSASLSLMGCTGPAVTAVVADGAGGFALANAGQINLGPYGGYGELWASTKVFLSIEMILGRLEILAPLVLLTPSFWRR